MLDRLLGFFRKVRVQDAAPARPVASPPVPEPLLTSNPTLKERVQKMRVIEAGRGGFKQPIVGESYRQDVLRRVKANAFIEVGDAPIATFLLAREPENRHDANAIAVLTEDGDVVGYLSRQDALQLQPTTLEHEQRGEVLSCYGKIIGEDAIGVWLDLPDLIEKREAGDLVEKPAAPIESPEEYSNLEVCRDVANVSGLTAGRKPYSRSRPNWVGSRIAAIGEERYAANLERVSKGRCEQGERITLRVLLVPDTANLVDPKAVMITSTKGDVLGYLGKSHAIRWQEGIQGFFQSDRLVCREAYLHQRTFKSGKRTFYLSVDMTDADWLAEASSR